MSLDRDLQSIQEARRLVEQAAQAQKLLGRFSQAQTDTAVAACAEAARQNVEALARLAVEETTYGIIADKVEKTLFSARDVYNAIKDLKTVGFIREDQQKRVLEIAVPAGVVAAIIPCTNPTSTAVFKALIALKARNAVVMSPHPSAVRCISETVRVMYEAALKAGAPEGCLSCLSDPTMEATQELMHHRQTAIILATGGTGLVRAAYSSGKPALGVGPGNVPAYIHSSANVPKAVADILKGKTFDNGTICSSEQHMVVDRAIADNVKSETERQGGVFLTEQQAEAVARLLILPNFRVNAKMVGQSADRIAREAGIAIPAQTRVLVARLAGIGRKHPLSAEKLSPVLSFYVVDDWRRGLEACTRFLEFGGMGHTMAIHATDDAIIRALALEAPAFRLVVNTPATHGSIGYTTNLFPSMSLGCGTPGGNITSDNLSPMHLINIRRLAYERRHAGQVTTTAPAATAPESTPAARHSVTPVEVAAEISGIVDRFLAARSQAQAQSQTKARNPVPRSPGSTSSTAVPVSQDQSEAPPEHNPSPTPARVTRETTADKPEAPRPADFVCEEDVKQAMRRGEKIYVGAKTIITPAARDLAEPAGLFVNAGRET